MEKDTSASGGREATCLQKVLLPCVKQWIALRRLHKSLSGGDLARGGMILGVMNGFRNAQRQEGLFEFGDGVK